MRFKLLFLTFAVLTFGVTFVFAVDAPNLLQPSNNSSVTSSKLEWQTPSYPLYAGGSYYMVQVDDQQTFENPEKNNIYLTNNYYSPQLNQGNWYWRVKVKDVNGSWSNWSNTWMFILSNSSPSNTPALIASPTPTTTPSQSPTSSLGNSSFTISNVPSQINSDQSFKTEISLSLPNYPNTTFYIKGAFKKYDSSNYFGLTKVGSSWVKNSETATQQLQINTNPSGNWSGNLEIQPDYEDSGFSGTDDYIFKVARYTNSGSGPIWSNESGIKIIKTNTSTNQGAPEPEKTSVMPTSSPKYPIPSSKLSAKTIISKPSSSFLSNNIASVAAESTSSAVYATPSAKIEGKNQKQFNAFLLIGAVLVFAGIGSLGYIYLKKR